MRGILLQEAMELFLDHRHRKQCVPDTLRLYRRPLGDWLEWRARQGLAPAVADVRLSDFTAYFDYLQREHIPHATNPRRPAAQKGGVKPNTADSIYRILRAF